jgi:hypothetical protein
LISTNLRFIPDGKEFCSLKRLIHQELTALIKSKSNSEADLKAKDFPKPVVVTKSASEIQEPARKHKSSLVPCHAAPSEMDHFLPKTKLKSTTQNFLHKQTPTIIYNSAQLNHRNMRQHTPPPIPQLSPG